MQSLYLICHTKRKFRITVRSIRTFFSPSINHVLEATSSSEEPPGRVGGEHPGSPGHPPGLPTRLQHCHGCYSDSFLLGYMLSRRRSDANSSGEQSRVTWGRWPVLSHWEMLRSAETALRSVQTLNPPWTQWAVWELKQNFLMMYVHSEHALLCAKKGWNRLLPMANVLKHLLLSTCFQFLITSSILFVLISSSYFSYPLSHQ